MNIETLLLISFLLDIRSIDFSALKRKGVTGVVIDRDNCLTLPRQDHVVTELQSSWDECKQVFGSHRCVILSNSAGTSKDPGLIQVGEAYRNTHSLRSTGTSVIAEYRRTSHPTHRSKTIV